MDQHALEDASMMSSFDQPVPHRTTVTEGGEGRAGGGQPRAEKS